MLKVSTRTADTAGTEKGRTMARTTDPCRHLPTPCQPQLALLESLSSQRRVLFQMDNPRRCSHEMTHRLLIPHLGMSACSRGRVVVSAMPSARLCVCWWVARKQRLCTLSSLFTLNRQQACFWMFTRSLRVACVVVHTNSQPIKEISSCW
jgi:hypothetical protein